MNKSRKLKFLLTSFSAVAITGVMATTLSSCGKNKNSAHNTPATGMSNSVSPFTKAALKAPLTKAITAHLGTTAFSLNPNIMASHAKVLFIRSFIVSSTSNLSGKITIKKVVYNYTATAVYNYGSWSPYTISNFAIHVAEININSATAIEPIIPSTTPVFGSSRLMKPVRHALSKYLVGNIFVLSPNIIANNIKTITVVVQSNPMTISSANIYGYVNVEGNIRSFSANAQYLLSDHSYAITNLNVNNVNPNWVPILPTPTKTYAPTNNTFISKNLTAPVTTAIQTKLGQNVQFSLAPKITVTNIKTISAVIQGKKIVMKYADIAGTITNNKNSYKYSARAIYDVNKKLYAIVNLKIVNKPWTKQTTITANKIFTSKNLTPVISASVKSQKAYKDAKVITPSLVTYDQSTFVTYASVNEKGQVTGYGANISATVSIDKVVYTYTATAKYTIGAKTPFVISNVVIVAKK